MHRSSIHHESAPESGAGTGARVPQWLVPAISAVVLSLMLSAAAPRPAGAAAGECLQPATSGPAATVTDCLFILQAATGSRTCSEPCICDADGDGFVHSSDALQCLRSVTGIGTSPLCTRCAVPLPELMLATRTSTFVPDDPEQYCPDYCPEQVAFSIFLAADGTGWVSIEEAFIHAVVVAVTWESTARGIEISSHSVYEQIRPGYYSGVGWTDMVIQPAPMAANGTAIDSGTATATVIYEFEIALFPEEMEFDVAFDLAPDDELPTLSVRKDDGDGPVFVIGDHVVVHSSRALLRDGLEGQVTVSVGGSTQPGTATAHGLNGPFATS